MLNAMPAVIERDSAVPIYQQLEDIFQARIASGEWAPNQRIPSENELYREYGLSRMTVRGVLNKLAADGLLVRVAGKGTFIAPTKISARSPAYRGIREQLEVLGYHISTELIATDRVRPPAPVRERLRLGTDDETFRIVRLRSVDDKPLSVHRSFVPAGLAPTLDEHDVVGEQLCVVLEERFGLPMQNVEEDLEAVAVDTADAKLLDLRRGAPALRLTDVISDTAGNPFEYSTIVFRGDTMRLKFDYQRG
jgi:GntR family transcriptional regulator